MLGHVAIVCEHLPTLPADPGRSNTDPWTVCRIIDSTAAILECSDTTLSADDLRVAREQLWRALAVTLPDTLSAQNYSNDSDYPVCIGELVVLATLRITALLRPHAAVDAIRVESIAWSANCARPVLSASMRDVIDALQITRTAFSEQLYNADLVGLVELLEFVCARLVHETGTRGIFDLDDIYCRPVPGATDEWMATPTFLQIVWPTLLGFQRRLIEARCLLGDNNDAPPRDADAAARMREWLTRQSERTSFRDVAPSLKRLVMKLHVRPGDRELYRLQFPTVTATDAGIVAKSVGEAYMAGINAHMHAIPATVIRREIHLGERDTLEFAICAHDFFDMLSRSSPGCEWALYFGRFEVEMDVDEVQRMSSMQPYLVYMFNGWQLAYDGCVYWYNSFIDALVAWLRLLDEAISIDNMIAAGGAHPDVIEHAKARTPAFAAAARADFYREIVRYVVQGLEPRPRPMAGAGAAFFV